MDTAKKMLKLDEKLLEIKEDNMKAVERNAKILGDVQQSINNANNYIEENKKDREEFWGKITVPKENETDEELNKILKLGLKEFQDKFKELIAANMTMTNQKNLYDGMIITYNKSKDLYQDTQLYKGIDYEDKIPNQLKMNLVYNRLIEKYYENLKQFGGNVFGEKDKIIEEHITNKLHNEPDKEHVKDEGVMYGPQNNSTFDDIRLSNAINSAYDIVLRQRNPKQGDVLDLDSIKKSLGFDLPNNFIDNVISEYNKGEGSKITKSEDGKYHLGDKEVYFNCKGRDFECGYETPKKEMVKSTNLSQYIERNIDSIKGLESDKSTMLKATIGVITAFIALLLGAIFCGAYGGGEAGTIALGVLAGVAGFASIVTAANYSRVSTELDTKSKELQETLQKVLQKELSPLEENISNAAKLTLAAKYMNKHVETFNSKTTEKATKKQKLPKNIMSNIGSFMFNRYKDTTEETRFTNMKPMPKKEKNHILLETEEKVNFVDKMKPSMIDSQGRNII